MVDIGPWLKWRRTRDQQRVSSSPLRHMQCTAQGFYPNWHRRAAAGQRLGKTEAPGASCSVTLTPPCMSTALPSAHQTENFLPCQSCCADRCVDRRAVETRTARRIIAPMAAARVTHDSSFPEKPVSRRSASTTASGDHPSTPTTTIPSSRNAAIATAPDALLLPISVIDTHPSKPEKCYLSANSAAIVEGSSMPRCGET